MILGGVHGVVESLFRRFTRQGMRSAALGSAAVAARPPLRRPATRAPAALASRPALLTAPPRPPCPCPAARSDEDAFKQSVESITGPITRIISRDGMLGVYAQFSDAGESGAACGAVALLVRGQRGGVWASQRGVPHRRPSLAAALAAAANAPA